MRDFVNHFTKIRCIYFVWLTLIRTTYHENFSQGHRSIRLICKYAHKIHKAPTGTSLAMFNQIKLLLLLLIERKEEKECKMNSKCITLQYSIDKNTSAPHLTIEVQNKRKLYFKVVPGSTHLNKQL